MTVFMTVPDELLTFLAINLHDNADLEASCAYFTCSVLHNVSL